jgi:hypothetical protein
MRAVEPEYLRDVIAQIVDVVTHAAHAKLAKVTKVLANLRGVKLNCSASACDEMVLIPAA